MTVDELVSLWAGTLPPERFTAFSVWLNAENIAGGGAKITNLVTFPYSESDDSQLFIINYGGTDSAMVQVAVASILFEEELPELAIATGRLILDVLRDYEVFVNNVQKQKEFEEDQKRWEIERDKQWKKWEEELKSLKDKEKKPIDKGDPGY